MMYKYTLNYDDDDDVDDDDDECGDVLCVY